MEKLIKEIKLIFPDINIHPKILKWWLVHYERIKNYFEIILHQEAQATKILEIGIGYGIIASFLSEYPKVQIICTEHPTRDYLWKKDFNRFFTSKGIKIVANDISSGLPFKNSSFDIVFFCDVIEHLPVEKIPQVIGEIYRVIKTNGTLILSTPNLMRLENILKVLKGKSPNPRVPVEIIGKTYGHIREFTIEEISSFLNPCFKIIRAETGLLPVFEGKYSFKEKVYSLFKRALPILKDEIYILAQKNDLP